MLRGEKVAYTTWSAFNDMEDEDMAAELILDYWPGKKKFKEWHADRFYMKGLFDNDKKQER